MQLAETLVMSIQSLSILVRVQVLPNFVLLVAESEFIIFQRCSGCASITASIDSTKMICASISVSTTAVALN